MNAIKIVRAIICGVGTAAAVAIVGGMSILNYRFASKLSDDGIDQVVYGAMAVAIVVVGTIVWLMIEAAWNSQRRKTAAGLCVAGAVFAAWALTMSAGHIGSNRLMADKGAGFADNRAASLVKDEGRLQHELIALGTYRDAGKIESELKVRRDSFTWVATDGCKTQKSAAHRKFCKAYSDLTGELSTAKSAQTIQASLRTVQTQIHSIGAGKVGDGQARVLNGLLHMASTGDANQSTERLSGILSIAQAIVSLFAELTIVRILIMLFGWKPEDLVGGLAGTIREVTAPAKSYTETVITRTAMPAHCVVA